MNNDDPVPADARDILEEFRQFRAQQPWRVRLKWRLRELAGEVRFFLSRRAPGWRSITLLLWKTRRQGIAGAWTPVFHIRKQNFDAFDKRLRWHGWGVLCENGAYRAYTPTNRSRALYPSPRLAWDEVELNYWGKPSITGAEWDKIK